MRPLVPMPCCNLLARGRTSPRLAASTIVTSALRHDDEVVALDAALLGREVAQAGPARRPGDGTERDAVARAGVVGNDRDPVDPLADLAFVDIDERGDGDPCLEQRPGVELAHRTGSPH